MMPSPAEKMAAKKRSLKPARVPTAVLVCRVKEVRESLGLSLLDLSRRTSWRPGRRAGQG